MNIILVHPVPGIVYMLLALVFFPLKTSLRLPMWGKWILFFIIIWFTLGVSDLGDMID